MGAFILNSNGLPVGFTRRPYGAWNRHCRRHAPPTASASEPEKKQTSKVSIDLNFFSARIDDFRRLLSDQSSLQAMSVISGLQDMAAMSTFQALAPTDVDHLCPIPSDPPFDPILALNLATYAFRAYQEPHSSAYRESLSFPAPPVAAAEVTDQAIFTDFVYPSTEHIASTATGAFLFDFDGPDAFVISQINHAVSRDVLRKKQLSVLRTTLHDDYEDILRLTLSKDESDAVPSHQASLSLKDLVQRALESGKQADQDSVVLNFEPISEAELQKDYFQIPLLPAEIRLPFWSGSTVEEKPTLPGNLSVTVRASFVPFGKQEKENLRKQFDEEPNTEAVGQDSSSSVTDSLEVLEEAILEAAEEQAEAEKALSPLERERRNALGVILSTQIQEGKMPALTDWKRLAAATTALSSRLENEMPQNGKVKVSVDAKPSLFVESHATDTEAWFFHDALHKSIVISFRGTEQVSWRDFFTDAQIFLQRWTPGDGVNLTIEAGRTVGLAEFLPSIVSNGAKSEVVPDDASAVHYGFLKAYGSVKDAVERAIDMIATDGDHSLMFTGHSLGGALATIAAADYAQRHVGTEVCCMSYGAPKVGNVNFARLYNELVPNSFRIVNDTDLVSRMPRSISGGGAVDRYRHSGRTVLVNNIGDYWIEGENNPALSDVGNNIDDPFREKYQDLNDLIEVERKLWEQLLSGRSVKHHMEDSYYAAIHQVVRRVAEGRSNRDG